LSGSRPFDLVETGKSYLDQADLAKPILDLAFREVDWVDTTPNGDRTWVRTYRQFKETHSLILVREFLLGETILNKGGTTNVPEKVMEALNLKPKRGGRSKLLWTPVGNGVIVTKGTPQSDWRKTMLRKNGTVAIPRHIQQALELRVTSPVQEKVLWILRGDQIIVRKGRYT
jgi:hypothetical protein